MSKESALCASIVLLAAVGASGADSMESVRGKLQQAAEKTTSFTCKQHTVISTDTSGGSIKGDEAGTFAYQRKDGKSMWRLEAKAHQVQTAAGSGDSVMDVDMLKFDDGERSWMVINNGGKVTAYRMRMRDNSEPTVADKEFFEKLLADNTLAVRPDETIDGKTCSIIEATPTMFAGKVGPGEAAALYAVQQDSGVIVREVHNDMKAKPHTTMTRSDIKINATIDPSQFAPPPGAEISEG